jgi:DNA uptake protein ComE-like DNA-binding protein
MAAKVRINLANSLELLELAGPGPQQAEAIVGSRTVWSGLPVGASNGN